MVFLGNDEIEVKKINWNYNPSVKDYLDITNHGQINDAVFPWRRIIIMIRENFSSPMNTQMRYSLTKSYKELSKFVEFLNIKTYVTEKDIEKYNRNIKFMLDEIQALRRKNEGAVIYGKYFISAHIIYGLIITLFFIYLKQYMPTLLICYPGVWIVSYLLSIRKKDIEIENRIRDIRISYSRLLSKDVDQLIDDIFDELVLRCKPK